ncbi:MAG: STM3941 family protein [Burkholderiales bacterium]
MHSTDDRIVIASSKVKLVLLTVGAFLFVAAGIWLFDVADTQGRYAPIYIKGVSVLAIGFFGLCGFYGLLKLFDGSPGLVLDREGIIDNSSAIAAGRVAWREIRDIRVMSVSGQRLLAVIVNDPEKYLGRGDILGRLFVKMNYKLYGTPIFISSHSLKVTFEDLEKQIQDFRTRHSNA